MDGVAARGLQWYRALGLGGLHSALRLLLSFLTIKLTAIYLGPSGLALVAQLANFIAICQGAVGAGIGSATARLVPEFRGDRAGRRRFLATAWRLAWISAVVCAAAMALASGPLARWLLPSGEHRTALVLAGVAVICLVLNHVIMCAINGAGEMGRVVASYAISAVAGFAVYVPASVVWGIPGGLVGYVLSQMLCLPVSLAVLRGSSRLAPGDFRGEFDRAEARRILGFMPMLVAHSAMSPLGLILIRDTVASQLGLTTAGLWQAAWRLSEVYLGIVMASVSLYFLPRLGEVAGTPGLRQEIVRTFLRAVTITAAVALAIFLLRDLVVRVVFTREFAPVRDLMPIQLVGDVLRMGGWTLGFVLVGLVRSRWYIALELLMPALYFGATLAFVPEYGMRGVPIAYCVAAAAHLGVSLFALRDILFRHENASGRPAGR